jgi:branched-chain amino acid transport system substrate-binding protein
MTAGPAPGTPPKPKRRVSRAVAAIIVVVVLVAAGIGGYATYRYYTASTPSNTITVGMPLPTNSLIGQSMLNAAQMAVNQINAAGGVTFNGTSYSYKIVPYDTEEADPSIPIQNGVNGVTTLISTDHVNFLIGGYRSDVVLAELPIVAKDKELYITYGADTGISQYVAQNYSAGGKYIFNGFLNTTDQSEQYGILPIFLLLAYDERAYTNFDTNITKIAILGEDAAWTDSDIGAGCGASSPCTPSTDLNCPLAADFAAVGFDPTYCAQFPLSPSGGSYDSLLTTLASYGTQAIYMLAAGTETPLLVSNYGAFDWGGDSGIPSSSKPLLLGADVMAEFNGSSASNNYYKMTSGGAAEEMTFGWGPTLPLALTPTSLAFYNQFEANYSLNPIFADGFVYSSFFYLAQAIEAAKSLNAAAVIPYLEQTDYAGPMGTLQFSSSHGVVVTFPGGQPSIPAFGMQWHSNGELYPLWSSLWSTPNFLALLPTSLGGTGAGGTASFENYQDPNGTVVGDFNVTVPAGY